MLIPEVGYRELTIDVLADISIDANVSDIGLITDAKTDIDRLGRNI